MVVVVFQVQELNVADHDTMLAYGLAENCFPEFDFNKLTVTKLDMQTLVKSSTTDGIPLGGLNLWFLMAIGMITSDLFSDKIKTNLGMTNVISGFHPLYEDYSVITDYEGNTLSVNVLGTSFKPAFAVTPMPAPTVVNNNLDS